MDDRKYIKKFSEGYLINIHVVPNSRKIRVEFTEDHIRIYLTSPPIKGKANKELIQFLSDALGIPKTRIKIEKGEKSRNKLVSLSGLTNIDPQEIIDKIEKYV